MFPKVDPNPPVLIEDTIRKIKYFQVGQEVHLNLQELLKLEEGWETEKEVIWQGPVPIIGHVDAIYRKDNLVVAVEIKPTHSEKPTPFDYNIRQLKYYLAMLNANYGILPYVMVGANPKEHFVKYLITFDYKNERNEILTRLEADAAELQRGSDAGRPELVKHAAKDPAFITYGKNWLCSSCEYKKECDEMRLEAGNFLIRWRISIKEG